MARIDHCRMLAILAAMAAATLGACLLGLVNPSAADAVTPTADLKSDMIGPAQLFVGAVDYARLVVTNKGKEPLTIRAGTVLVRDTLTGATFDSAGSSGFYQGAFSSDFKTVEYTATKDDTIRPGTTRSFTFSPRLTQTGTVSHSVTVDPDNAVRERDETNNGPITLETTVVAAPATTPVADLTLATTDQPDPVKVGKTLTYTLDLTNNGPDPVPPGTLIYDTLPKKTKFVSAQIEAGRGDCVFMRNGFQSIECRVSDTIAAGDTVSATIAVVPKREGKIENAAWAQSAGRSVDDPNGIPSDTEITRVRAS